MYSSGKKGCRRRSFGLYYVWLTRLMAQPDVMSSFDVILNDSEAGVRDRATTRMLTARVLYC
jgi:hypothetical protein